MTSTFDLHQEVPVLSSVLAIFLYRTGLKSRFEPSCCHQSLAALHSVYTLVILWENTTSPILSKPSSWSSERLFKIRSACPLSCSGWPVQMWSCSNRTTGVRGTKKCWVSFLSTRKHGEVKLCRTSGLKVAVLSGCQQSGAVRVYIGRCADMILLLPDCGLIYLRERAIFLKICFSSLRE